MHYIIISRILDILILQDKTLFCAYRYMKDPYLLIPTQGIERRSALYEKTISLFKWLLYLLSTYDRIHQELKSASNT